MKRIWLGGLVSLVGILACRGDRTEIETIDFTTEQMDVLFVSATFPIPQIFAVKDSFPEEIWNISYPFGYHGFASDGVFDPTWSPDGRKYAFANAEYTIGSLLLHSNIYVFNLDSSYHRLSSSAPVTYDTLVYVGDTLTGIRNLRPDWSPDGSKMVFLSDRFGPFQIFTTDITDSLYGNPDATALTDATDDLDLYCAPSFSPDGRKIVYTAKSTGNEEIWVMNVSGTGKTRLTFTSSSVNRRPRFSPDGTRIAFTSNVGNPDNHADSTQIMVMNADGSGLTAVTATFGNSDPAWSPDGQRIVFSKRVSGTRSYIYMIDADGTDEVRWLHDGKAFYPIWRPAAP